jgi:hypothetical protein
MRTGGGCNRHRFVFGCLVLTVLNLCYTKYYVNIFPSGDIFIIEFYGGGIIDTSIQCPFGDIKYRVNILLFWDITPCSPLKVNGRFGGIYRLHLQGGRISRTRNQRESRRQRQVST